MDRDYVFKERILLECYDALEKHGFTRFSKLGVDYPIHDGFHCWVGINVAQCSDRVELVPNVGLHVVPIEEMVCTLDKGEYATDYDRGVATYSINIGELASLGDERAFSFSHQQSDYFIYTECERLAVLYATEGLRYAKSIASYEYLVPLLKENVGTLGGNPERLAACLYLMGKKLEAMEFLSSFPEKYKEYIKGFSVPFLEKVRTELES
jgi:hypothetical protein